MWTVYIRDKTAGSVLSDLNLHCPLKLLVSSSVRKEVNKKTSSLKTHFSLFIWGFTSYQEYFRYLTATVRKSMFPGLFFTST